MATIFHIDSDQHVTVTGLTDAATGAYVNNATISAQMYDEDGDEKGDAFSPSYTAESNGDYTGTLLDTVTTTLTPYKPYKLRLTITSGTIVKVVDLYGYAGVATS